MTPKEEEKLWDFMMGEYSYILQGFGTAVVGIGALFFAYGSVNSPIGPESGFGATMIGTGISDELKCGWSC